MKNIYLGCIAASVVLASTSAISKDIKLKTVTVEGKKKEVYSVPIPLKQSLTANTSHEAKLQAKKVSGSVAVIDKEEFENTKASNFKDILEFTPGVFVQTRYGEESRVSIRGTGLSRTFHLRGLRLLQDGMPMNLADGSADFQELDPSAYSHIEVFKGANALKYGANTLGGAINFVTPTGYTADKFRTGMGIGSFDTRKNFASSGGVLGKLDYFINVSDNFSSGFRDHNDQNNFRMLTNMGYRFNDNLETRFYFSYVDANLEIPGSLTKAQQEANPTQAGASNLSGDQQRDYYLYRLANKTTYRGEDFTANAGLYTIQKDLFHPIFQVVDQQNNDFGAFSDVTFFGSLFGLENELLVGSNFSTGRVDAKQFVNVGGFPTTLTNFNNQKSINIDVFTENRVKATEQLSLIAGTQVVYAQREYSDYFPTDGDRSGEKLYKGLSPKIGAIYDLSHKTQLFTNYSWSYEPPTFSELTQAVPGVSGLVDIEAQRSQTFEIGTRGELEKVNWDIAWYYSWLKDEILTYSTGVTTTATLNAQDTIHTGVELGLGAVVANNLFTGADDVKVKFSYSYNDFKFDEDANWGNNAIPGAPDHFVITELRYTHPSSFYIASVFEATPEKYPVDMANTLYADPYAIFGLKAGYDIAKDVTLFMDARNLADKNYTATTGVITTPGATNQAQFMPGDGRSFYFGIRYKLN